MAHSMTSYGRATGSSGGKDFVVELKSVNSRFFDCSVKISNIYGYLEEKIKSYLLGRGISRGKLNVFVGIDVTENLGAEITLDEAYAAQYISSLRSLANKFNLKDDITVTRVAANKEIFNFKKPEENIERDWLDLLPTLERAADAFLEMRENEGETLKRDLCDKMETVKELTSFIKDHADDAQELYKQRLETKLKAVLEGLNYEVDSARILIECAIFAEKTAIDEELVRLESHFSAFYDTISGDEAVGRKLDFLFQEINREVNTIGSKVSDAQLTKAVVEIKNLLEKIREQIQNLE